MEMKKILIPVDESDASKNSLLYGLELRKKFGFELVVLRVSQTENKDTARELLSLKHFCQIPPHKNDVVAFSNGIQYRLESGVVASTINKVAEEEQVDFILIGTRNKHGLKDYLLGSVCTKLRKATSIPVLIIPENYSFEPIENICFLQDVIVDQNEDPKWLVNYAKMFEADLEKLYINPIQRDFYSEKESVFSLPDSTDFDKLNVVRDTSLNHGIDYFLSKNKVSILAIYLKDRSWFQQLVHNNLSKKLILKSSMPILIKNDLV